MSKIPRSQNPLSPEDKDWFCRHFLPELAAFQLIASTGSRQVIGNTLGKTRAGVGKAIPRAERALANWFDEVLLIDHSRSRAIVATEVGESMLRFANEVIARSEKFLDEIHRIRTGTELTIVTIHSSWMAYGPQLEGMYKERIKNGRITTRFYTGNNYIRQIETEIRQASADIGITSYPPRQIDPPLCVQPLLDQEMMLVFPANYPKLPRKGGTVRVRDVMSQNMNVKFVIYNRQLSVPANDKVMAYLHQQNAKPDKSQVLEGINIAAIKDTLKSFPDAISILPAHAVRNEVEKGEFKVYSLDPPMKPWRWGVISRQQSSRPAVSHFLAGFEALGLLKKK